MPTIEIDGRITDEGTLEMELPAGLPPGGVHITIETLSDSGWSPQELEDALRVEPWSGKQIVEAGLLGGWADQGFPAGKTGSPSNGASAASETDGSGSARYGGQGALPLELRRLQSLPPELKAPCQRFLEPAFEAGA